MHILKKLAWGTAGVMMLWAFSFSLAAAAQTYPDGTVVRAKGESKVYAMFRGHKYWMRTPEVLRSYGFSWKQIQETDAGTLGNYPDVFLIRREGDAKVFYVKGEEKRWIATADAFNANKFDWNLVKPVSAADFESYGRGTDITGDISGTTVTFDLAPALLQSDVPPGVDFSLLWNVWKSIEERYKDSATLDRQKMVQGAADGLVKSLGDPYTVFMKPEDARKFSEDVAGKFFGIGAELGYKNGVVIISPLKGLAAERAGVAAGDKIVRIDGTSTIDMTVEDAVMRIRGEKDTKVTLTVERQGRADLLEFIITRELVKVPTLEWTRKTNDIFYLKIHNFFGAVEEDFRAAAKEMQAQGMRKLILDMRNNPGGLLDASINIAAEFVPKGKLIVSADFGNGKSKEEFTSPGGGLLEKTPVVVLMNKGSASASEILAGALKDSSGATLLGERSFGKGTIQEILRLAGGATLKVTAAQWVRPSGKPIGEDGIEPDVKILLTDEESAAGRDPQLDKALELAKSLPL